MSKGRAFLVCCLQTGEAVLVFVLSSASSLFSYLLIHIVSYGKLLSFAVVSNYSFSSVFLRPFSEGNITLVLTSIVMLPFFLCIYNFFFFNSES